MKAHGAGGMAMQGAGFMAAHDAGRRAVVSQTYVIGVVIMLTTLAGLMAVVNISFWIIQRAGLSTGACEGVMALWPM